MSSAGLQLSSLSGDISEEVSHLYPHLHIIRHMGIMIGDELGYAWYYCVGINRESGTWVRATRGPTLVPYIRCVALLRAFFMLPV